tara:strand:- start:141 stop:605 length:465 start_codon:yes stop_codon:yes gene_type:complete
MKMIPNPTPPFDEFCSETKIRLALMKAPEIPDDLLKKIWDCRRKAKFYTDKNYQCLRHDSIKYMPHRDNKVFSDLIGDTLIWLAISRFDGMPISWSDKQDIKNAVVGYDHEAVELYPNQDRCVTWGEEDHLWCLKNPSLFHPFGFGEFEEEENT